MKPLTQEDLNKRYVNTMETIHENRDQNWQLGLKCKCQSDRFAVSYLPQDGNLLLVCSICNSISMIKVSEV